MTGYYLSKYEVQLSQLNKVELILTRLNGIVGNLILTKLRLIFVPNKETVKSEEKGDPSALYFEYLEIPVSSIYDIIIVWRTDKRSYITSKKISQKESIKIVGKNSRIHFFKPERNKGAETKTFLDLLSSFLTPPTKISNGSTTHFYDHSPTTLRKYLGKESHSQTNKTENTTHSKSDLNINESLKIENLNIANDIDSISSQNKHEIIISPSLTYLNYLEDSLLKKTKEEAWDELLVQSGGERFFCIGGEIPSPRLKDYSCHIIPKNKSNDWGTINNQFIDKRGPLFSCFFKKCETVLYSSGTLMGKDAHHLVEQPITKYFDLNDSSLISDKLLQSILPTDLKNRKIALINIEWFLQKSPQIHKSYKEISTLCTLIGCKKIADKLRNKSKVIDPTLDQSGIVTKYTTKTFFSKLQATEWYTLVSKILTFSVDISHIYKSCNVIISEKETYYSYILISLIKIMVEPFYRSPVGFWYLIFHDWLTNGYDFANCLCDCNKFTKSSDPLFFLFLDCVHQLWNQFPRYFKFNENFLVLVSDTVLSGLFKPFENKNKQIDEKYPHLDIFDYNTFWMKYTNPLYHVTKSLSYELPDIDCLEPITFQSGLVLWGDFFLRYTKGYTRIKYDWKGHHTMMVKYVEEILNASSKDVVKEKKIPYSDFVYDIPLTFINDILLHAESTLAQQVSPN